MPTVEIELPTLHEDQERAFRAIEDLRVNDPATPEGERKAWAANSGGRFKVIRCGRRWGKSKLGETWIGDGAIKQEACGWFAPDYAKQAEVFEEMKTMLEPIIKSSSKTDKVIRLKTGGRIDFWTLDNENAGRSRFYHRVFIDEAAFTKNNMIDIWKKSIKPTLFDYGGQCWIGSNTNGVDPENFMYQVCHDPSLGFISYHAPTSSNPLLPKRLPDEPEESHAKRRLEAIEEIRRGEHPLVFRQEYLAEFVDWSGTAFFEPDKWLVGGLPVSYPANCDGVFAVIDTATKTGTDNDGTAVTYFARNLYTGHPLIVLDWDILQIEGALLENWLPSVFENLERLAALTKARNGSLGVWIEDKSSGMVLLQQARIKGLPAHQIDTKLTAVGKDERALSISGYHFRGEVKISDVAFNKVCQFKTSTRNHFVAQVTGFRVGDKDAAKRADDLLDTYCYGVSLALGNNRGF